MYIVAPLQRSTGICCDEKPANEAGATVQTLHVSLIIAVWVEDLHDGYR